MTKILNYSFFILNALVSLGFLTKVHPNLIANTVATTLFFAGIMLVEKFTSFRLKNYIRLMLLITLISHSLLGEYFQLYYTTGYFDNALHLFGSLSFALFTYELISSFMLIQSSRPILLTFILVSLLGICLGTLFELIEFTLDQLLKERNQFGLVDTDLDLLFDVLGSLLAGAIASLTSPLLRS